MNSISSSNRSADYLGSPTYTNSTQLFTAVSFGFWLLCRLAVVALIQPGGKIDLTMRMGRTGMFSIIKDRYAKWSLQEDGKLCEKHVKKRCYQTTITEMMGGRCGERLRSMFEQQSPAIMVSRPIISCIHQYFLDWVWPYRQCLWEWRKIKKIMCWLNVCSSCSIGYWSELLFEQCVWNPIFWNRADFWCWLELSAKVVLV